MKAFLTFLALVISSTAAFAQSGSLQLFHATGDSPSQTDFSRPGSGAWVINGTLYSQFIHVYGSNQNSIDGVIGANFYLSGFEEMVTKGFQVLVTPDPVINVAIGNPVLPVSGQRQYALAGSSCLSTNNGLAFLTSVHLFIDSPSGPPDGFFLDIAGSDPPMNPTFDCPQILSCAPIIFPTICVSSASFCVGGPPLPINPTPADQAVGVSPEVTLSWSVSNGCCVGLSTPRTEVFLGVEEPLERVFINYADEQFSYTPGTPLAPKTTYFWRIATSPDVDCGLATGQVWSFTTSDFVRIEGRQWSVVKKMYQ